MHLPIVVDLIVNVGSNIEVFLRGLGMRQGVASSFVGITTARFFIFATNGIVVERAASRQLQPRQGLNVEVEHWAEHCFGLPIVVFVDAPP